jgi:hypothetical protein
MILLIASNLEISVKTVTKNKFIVSMKLIRKMKLLFFVCLFSFFFSYSQIKGKCIDENGKGIPT